MDSTNTSDDAGGLPLRIGLTGGIASGKSTVANMFAALGACVIDADDGARAVVAPGSHLLDELSRQFGDEILRADGSLDRRALRETIFDDAAARSTLEGLLHPAIWAWMARQGEQAFSEKPDIYQLLVVPLLVETEAWDKVDRVLVVDCPVQTQVARLIARDAESEAAARRMIDTQATREQRLEVANDVLDSTQSMSDMQAEVAELHRKYLALSVSHLSPG